MWAFLLAAVVSILAGPAVIFWYKRNGWLDNPEQHRHVKNTHTKPVPRGGGLVVWLGVMVASVLMLPFDHYLLAILAAATLLAVVGFLDDIWDIHPLIRLGTGLLAALIVVGSGIGIAYISNPVGPGVIHLDQWQLPLNWGSSTRNIWVLADAFAVFFILWNMNIINWSKGVAGQLPGFVSIATFFIGLLALRFADDPTNFRSASLAFIVSGAFIGLLIWNFHPQRLMAGYGAGSLAGFFVSVLAILSGAKVATTLMVIAIPTADAVFTIARRLRAGKSPLWGDRGHLHHKLMDVLGWSQPQIAFFYWITSLVLGLLSLYLNTWGKIITITLVYLFVFGFLIWAKLYPKKKQLLTT